MFQLIVLLNYSYLFLLSIDFEIMNYALDPPDTLIVSPVIAEAPSEAKNRTVSAISCGSNKRFIGILPVIYFSIASCSVELSCSAKLAS